MRLACEFGLALTLIVLLLAKSPLGDLLVAIVNTPLEWP